MLRFFSRFTGHFTYIIVIFVTAQALSSCNLSNAQRTVTSNHDTTLESDVSNPLPIDDKILKGELKNGLKYIVRENSKPENFAELRLIVKTGSIFEDDSQRGFAHFAEHMAFNGTEDFKAQEIIAFVESIGMRFGAHLNASTSFDNTIYQLRVPTSDPKVIETAIHILQNWASKITFDANAIDEERGVVLEEWRSRKGVGERIGKQQWPITYAGTNYATRLPIGTKDSILNGKHKDLVHFYKTWYRPDLMAVVAVGDFQSTNIEALIKKYFTPLTKPNTAAPQITQYLTQHDAPVISAFTDEELSSINLSISWRTRVTASENTLTGYRARIIKNLLNGVLSKRITDKSLDTSSAFTSANVGFGKEIPTAETFYLSANIKPGRTQEAFADLLTEIKRAVDHGVSEQELTTEKRLYMEWFDSMLESQNTLSHQAYLQSYIEHFLNDAPLMSIAQDFALTKTILENIGQSDLQQQMHKWADHQDAIVFLSAPENTTIALPNSHEMLNVWEQVQASQPTALVDKAQVTALMSNIPVSGSVVAKTYIEKWDAHEWQLSNGIKVVLKPTKFRENAIFFSAISNGGYALVDDETYLASFGMMNTLDFMGLGDLDMEQLAQFSREKRFSVNPSVNEYTESISGHSNKEDLLYMMQSIYLRFTAPVKDAGRFEWMKENYRPRLANKYNSANAQFYAAIQAKTQGDNPRNVEFDVAMLDKQNLDTIFDLYKQRFANAADFTFVFVGDMDLTEMETLLSQYVASLPTSEHFEEPKKLPNYAMQGEYKVQMKKGTESKANVILSLFGEAKWSYQNELVVQALKSALAKDLTTRLREELGAVYSVNVDAQLSRWPYQNYSITISFTCDPNRIEALYDEVQGIFAKYIKGEINAQQLENFKIEVLTSHAKSLKENSFWLNHMLAHYTPFEPLSPEAFPPLVNSLQTDMLINAAKLYLQSANVLYATLQPEAPESPLTPKSTEGVETTEVLRDVEMD